ncbi:MAG: hypothetical protein J0M33_11460 [Anaerolineae bacterium]|nr:hypothetical protein [Anaerolineae bacterium]
MGNKRYRIAIVGSYKPERETELQIQHINIAPQAGEQLGQALGKKGFNIITYASYAGLLEVDVVRGYTQVVEAEPKCIEVHYAEETGQPHFTEAKVDDQRFSFQPDHSKNWEVSFYQSIAHIDGMLLLGGGPSALIAGIVAISHNKPIVVCASFGGKAKGVWEALGNHNVLATSDEIKQMAVQWSPTSAERMVDILAAQISRVEAVQSKKSAAEKKHIDALLSAKDQSARQSRNSAIIGCAALILALVVYFLALNDPVAANRFWPLFMLVSASLTGVAGAVVTGIFDKFRGVRTKQQAETLYPLLLGAVAGFVTAGLFVLAQSYANPVSTGETVPILLYDRLILSTSIIGLIAGLTFEAVLKRLREIDVVQRGPVQAVQPTSASDTTSSAAG